MWKNYHMPDSEEQLTDLLVGAGPNTRIISGGTDLMVEIRNGKWPELETVIDISRISGLDQITRDSSGMVHIEALVTHNNILQSPILREYAYPLVQACWRVATPMLRNRATVVGNLITASPANDTITPLLAMDASLVLVSNAGKRVVPLEEFYTGLRKTVLRPDEYVQEIVFKGLQPNQPGVFIKQSLRRAQAISVINCCVLLEMDEDVVKQARVTMGSVATTVIHSPLAEAYLVGKRLDEEVASEAGRLAGLDAKPITDVRGSQDYRQYMVGLLVEDAVRKLLEGNLQALVPANPAVLDTHEGVSAVHAEEWDQETIETTINGETYIIPGYTDGTLLYMVRDRVGLTGTKVGCEEGECGACTLYLDGKAVVSCLVPAPRAHHARVTTIEGISNGEQLHPVQQAFVDHSAVQCGYCTPGFVMSAAKLLEENPHPDRDTIKYAISGNLCRCTGYYKIVEAIESVCMQEGRPE